MIDFNKCTDKAYEILLEQKGEIPVDVASLLLNEPIIFDTLQNYAKLTNTTMEHLTINHKIENGYIIKQQNFYIILNNDEHTEQRCNFTRGHELGHIVLNHTTDSSDAEVEANFFSAQLLMPNPLVKYLAFKSYKQHMDVSHILLREFFGVSDLAARKKIRTLNKYYSEHKWDCDLIIKYKESLDFRFESLISLYHPSSL